jgi:hypothetical protein
MSLWVHWLLSLHGALLGVLVQPIWPLQVSAVHGLPSSQFLGLPLHTLDAQKSPSVQGLPSSQLPLSAL